MFNSDELSGKWTEIKGEINKKWGELTDSELEKTKGNAESLVGLVQQKLGVKKEEAHTHLSELAGRWRGAMKDASTKVADRSTNQRRV